MSLSILSNLGAKVFLRYSSLTPYRLSSTFSSAQKKLNTLSKDPGNEIKLKLYALYKQASSGDCSSKRPGMIDFVGRAKWDAWNEMKGVSKDEAEKQYTEIVESLASLETNTPPTETTSGNYPGLLYSVKDGVGIITFDRPAKKNAVTLEMYLGFSQILESSAKDDSVKFVVLTGQGDFYSSGNDLGNFTKQLQDAEGDLAKASRNGADVLRPFIDSFIAFPKPLISLVNGPAIGIMVTILGLFDVVYAAEDATFHTPFSTLGQSPEGCSSYTFPRIMGHSKAMEMLMYNRKLTAREAYEYGLVTRVLPTQTFAAETQTLLDEMKKCSAESCNITKELVRAGQRDTLHRVNKEECERLVERWQSEDCINAVTAFMTKSK